MKNEFVAYEQAVELKELGFNYPCLAQYGDTEEGIGFEIWNDENYSMWENSVGVPLYQQTFKFFREKYQVFTYIHLYRTDIAGNPLEFEYYYRFPKKKKSETVRNFNTYEEAEKACLDKLIRIIKNDF